MKKSLIALAALAFVGAASAQSSVTLYGIADIWVGKGETATKDKVAAGSGGLNTSRWGLKGSEELGGGLKAVFTFEQAVDLGTGAATGFTRQANVGLESGLGTLKLGKNWTALDDIYGAADSLFNAGGLSLLYSVWRNSYTDSADAQIYYATPDFAGFSGAVSTQLKGNTATKTTSMYAKYANGPVYFGIGYEDAKVTAQKGTLVNGSYDLGVAKLTANYYTTKPNGGGAKTNSYAFGVDVPLSGALTLSAGYASSKLSGTKSATGFGVAAAYSLSKRTTVYGGVRATNDVAKHDFWAVGVNHKF